jgi:hypothetical protein
VRAVKAATFREDILGQSLLQPQSSDLSPDLLLDVLHQKQFGGTLALTILVITSDASEGAYDLAPDAVVRLA